SAPPTLRRLRPEGDNAMQIMAKKRRTPHVWRPNEEAWLGCTLIKGSDPSEYKVMVDLPNFSMPMSSYVHRDDVREKRSSDSGWVRVTVMEKGPAGRDYVVVRFPGETEWRGRLTPVPLSYLGERPEE